MSAPNVIGNIPAVVFLAPLIKFQIAYEERAADLVHHQETLAVTLTTMVNINRALPLELRHRQLFELEEVLNKFTLTFLQTQEALKVSVENLQVVANDVLKLDTKYREEALRLVYGSELALRQSIKTVATILEEIEFTSTTLLID